MIETKKVAAVAEGAGLGLYGGRMIETSLGSTMALCLYPTIHDFEFSIELFSQFLYNDCITVEELEVREYELVIPGGPGFALMVDIEKVKKYAREFY